MVGVPQVWELLRKGIVAKVEEGGSLKRSVFNLAVKAKSRAMEKSIPGVAGVTNALVFNQVQRATGGRLRTLFNGGSTLARSTQSYLSAALVKMIQGYGLTEGTAMACILHPNWVSYGSVGGPVPGAEIKLVDRPEEGLGYLSTDSPPRGEIYVRGPAVFKGYFNRPQLDAEAFTEDRWFKTGDIGQWNDDGTLTIIDRIRNHMGLSGGRYITLERLEAIYRCCSFVLNGCVLAYPNHTNPAMVVIVHPTNLPVFARKHGLNVRSEQEMEALCESPHFVQICLNELNSLAKKEGLQGQELLEAIVLTTDDWTAEGGFLTAAQSKCPPPS
jgi:long-chain acyl-CoA synthetase